MNIKRQAAGWAAALALALLAACQTPMDHAPLPAAPRRAQLSAPAAVAPGGAVESFYVLDGQLLKALRAADGGLLWAQPVGYFWQAQPVAGADGGAYVMTYDPAFPPDRPAFVLRGFSPGGAPRGEFAFDKLPTQPLLLPDGRLAIGLAPRGGGLQTSRAGSAEPAGATLVVLSPDLELDWSSAAPTQVRRQPATDGARLYATDAAALHVFELDGGVVGTAPLGDASFQAELEGLPGRCAVAVGNLIFGFDGTTQVWQRNVQLPVRSGTLCHDAANVYCINGQNKLLALSQADGSLSWAAQLAAAPTYRLAYDSAADALFAVLGGGEAGTRDLFLRFDTAGVLQFSQWLPQRVTSPLAPADGGVAFTAAPNRDSFRRTLLWLGPDAAPRLAVEAAEALPQAVVNGQSTLSPPWPAIE